MKLRFDQLARGGRQGQAILIEPVVGLVIGLLGLLLVYVVVGPSSAFPFLNWVGPALVLIGCVLVAATEVAFHPSSIATPLPWFLAACAAFFGFGPLLYTFGNPAALGRETTPPPFGAIELWRTNVLNVVGIVTILATFVVAWFWIGSPAPSRARRDGDRLLRCCVAFLLVGLPVKYLLTIPYELGQLGYTLPGSVFWLRELDNAGLLLLGYIAGQRRGWWLLACGLLVSADVLGTALTFSKSAAFFTAIAPVAGWYLARRRFVDLVLLGVLVVALYTFATPLTLWARGQLVANPGTTLAERVSVLGRGWRGDKLPAVVWEQQTWWARLSFANEQAFVMRRYDAGEAGTSFDRSVLTLVPRAIWPDKPILTSLGVDFTETLRGHRLSSTGIGVFGEAYWNGGWVFVLLAGGWIGLLFAVLSRFALVAIEARDFTFVPCVWLGMLLGFKITSWFAPTYVGLVVLYLAYCVPWALFLRPSSKVYNTR